MNEALREAIEAAIKVALSTAPGCHTAECNGREIPFTVSAGGVIHVTTTDEETGHDYGHGFRVGLVHTGTARFS